MLKLKVVQAEFGDCLLLRYGSETQPGYLLVDGGPSETYPMHLKPVLEQIAASGACLDLVVLSHVDNDHIIGLLEMMADMVRRREKRQPDLLPVRGLWHNSFERTMGGNRGLVARVDSGLAGAGASFANAAAVTFGISEGNKLLMAAQQLKIPINPHTGGGTITTAALPRPVELQDLKLWVLGPTPQNLEQLQTKWLAWLDTYQKRAPFAGAAEAEKLDRSVPNLSSIMLLAQSGRRKILLTGDATSDDVLEGLRAHRLMPKSGVLNVDVLKMPHHGSARNVRKAFFDTVRAKTYVISANGRDGNPDLATLIWLVSAAKEQRRKIKILATNAPESIEQLMEEYPPKEWGYSLQILPAGQHALEV